MKNKSNVEDIIKEFDDRFEVKDLPSFFLDNRHFLSGIYMHPGYEELEFIIKDGSLVVSNDWIKLIAMENVGVHKMSRLKGLTVLKEPDFLFPKEESIRLHQENPYSPVDLIHQVLNTLGVKSTIEREKGKSAKVIVNDHVCLEHKWWKDEHYNNQVRIETFGTDVYFHGDYEAPDFVEKVLQSMIDTKIISIGDIQGKKQVETKKPIEL